MIALRYIQVAMTNYLQLIKLALLFIMGIYEFLMIFWDTYFLTTLECECVCKSQFVAYFLVAIFVLILFCNISPAISLISSKFSEICWLFFFLPHSIFLMLSANISEIFLEYKNIFSQYSISSHSSKKQPLHDVGYFISNIQKIERILLNIREIFLEYCLKNIFSRYSTCARSSNKKPLHDVGFSLEIF